MKRINIPCQMKVDIIVVQVCGLISFDWTMSSGTNDLMLAYAHRSYSSNASVWRFLHKLKDIVEDGYSGRNSTDFHIVLHIST